MENGSPAAGVAAGASGAGCLQTHPSPKALSSPAGHGNLSMAVSCWGLLLKPWTLAVLQEHKLIVSQVTLILLRNNMVALYVVHWCGGAVRSPQPAAQCCLGGVVTAAPAILQCPNQARSKRARCMLFKGHASASPGPRAVGAEAPA